MSDPFENYASNLDTPATHLQLVTPSDTDALEVIGRAITVTVGGLITVTTLSGDKGQIFVDAGGVFPIRVRQIWSTDTDADGIHIMW